MKMKAWAAASLLVLLATVACSGGSSDDPPASTAIVTTAQSQTTGSASSSAAAEPSPTNPPTATTAPPPTATPEPQPFDIFSVTPGPVPDLTGASLVTQPQDRFLTDTLRAVFAQAGGDFPGLALYVFSIAGTAQKMLVLDYADTGGVSVEAASTGGDAALDALLLAPEVAQWNITRLTINLRSTDAQGPLIVTVTTAIDQAAVQAGADITQGALVEIQRP